MTIVVGGSLRGIPLLMGDVLVTGPAKAVPLQATPILGRRAFKGIYNGRAATALVSKLVIVNDYVALGWSNNLMHAKLLINEVMKFVGPNAIPADKLQNFIIKTIGELGLRVEVIGICLEGADYGIFGVSDQAIAVSPGNELRIIGSGFAHKQYIIKYFELKKETTLQTIDSALASLISLSLSFVNYELINASTMHNFYGAGYEFVVPFVDDNRAIKLKKFEGSADLFWFIDVDENGDIQQVRPSPIVLRKFYSGKDFVMVRLPIIKNESIVLEGDEKPSLFVAPAITNIPTLWKSDKIFELPEKCPYFAHLLIKFLNNKPKSFITLVERNPKDISFMYKNNNVEFAYQNSVLLRMANAALQRL